MVQRDWVRDVGILERGIVGVDNVVVVAKLSKGCVMEVSIVMLVLGLERWVDLVLGSTVVAVYVIALVGYY
jgi:hypothetical protein